MKPRTNVPLPRTSVAIRKLQSKIAQPDKRYQFKEQTGKQQKIVLSVNAGRVRGGHSFH